VNKYGIVTSFAVGMTGILITCACIQDWERTSQRAANAHRAQFLARAFSNVPLNQLIALRASCEAPPMRPDDIYCTQLDYAIRRPPLEVVPIYEFRMPVPEAVEPSSI
jgi:hypothetical protein